MWLIEIKMFQYFLNCKIKRLRNFKFKLKTSRYRLKLSEFSAIKLTSNNQFSITIGRRSKLIGKII